MYNLYSLPLQWVLADCDNDKSGECDEKRSSNANDDECDPATLLLSQVSSHLLLLSHSTTLQSQFLGCSQG